MVESQTYQLLETPEQVEDLMAPDGGAALLYFWGPQACGGGCGCGTKNVECFNEMAELYEDDPIRFGKVDISTHPGLTRPFNIRVIPTYLFVFNGEIIDVFTGGIDPQRLGKRTEALLSKARGEGLISRMFKRRDRRFTQLTRG